MEDGLRWEMSGRLLGKPHPCEKLPHCIKSEADVTATVGLNVGFSTFLF